MEKKVLEVLKRRRAIYPENFNDDKITTEEVKELLEVMRFAPTHRLTEPWRIHVFMNEEKTKLAHFLREKIDEAAGKPGKGDRTVEKFERAQAILAVGYQKDEKERVPEWEELAATSMAVQNFWIYTRVKGMGGYLSTGQSTIDGVTEYLDLSDDWVVMGIFYLGKTSHVPRERPAKTVDEFTKWHI